MKNITLSADEALIEAARERAMEEKTTLNAQFRVWLAEYSRVQDQLKAYDETIRAYVGNSLSGGS